MNNEGNIFEEYTEKKTLLEKMKKPKFWIKYILIVLLIVFAIFIYNSYKSTWSRDDVKNSIEIVSVETGWMEGKSELRETAARILPFLSFKVKNIGKKPLHFVNFESVYEFQSDGAVQSSGFFAAFQSPLAVGETSDIIVLKAVNGYTASSKEAFYKNKDKWRKVNGKIFARTQGSPPVRVGGLYPVDQQITGFRADIDIESAINLAAKIEVVITDSGWLYKTLEGKNVLVYPSITFRIKNTGDTTLSKLGLKGIFRFERNGERFNFGYPAVKGDLEPGKESEKITMRSEFGIHASSLQALYNNIFEWDEVTVKLMIKVIDSQFESIGDFPIKNEIKGVKVINK